MKSKLHSILILLMGLKCAKLPTFVQQNNENTRKIFLKKTKRKRKNKKRINYSDKNLQTSITHHNFLCKRQEREYTTPKILETDLTNPKDTQSHATKQITTTQCIDTSLTNNNNSKISYTTHKRASSMSLPSAKRLKYTISNEQDNPKGKNLFSTKPIKNCIIKLSNRLKRVKTPFSKKQVPQNL